jgi:UDP-glucose 4-epimerase
VNDLAEAHALALHRLSNGEPSFAVNLGTGEGHSILQMLKSVEEVTGSRVIRKEGPRRAGDPPALVADPTRAQKLLGWKATRSLRDIVSTAWNWMQASNSRKP